jgi:hypothetical protein
MSLQSMGTSAPSSPSSLTSSGMSKLSEPQILTVMDADGADSTDDADKYDVFISFRVKESLKETKMLRDALAAVGVKAYVCEEQLEVGQDWATEIFGALESCEVFLVMGTPTYGAKGMEIMATWEELSYALRYNKFVYIVKLFDGRYEQVRARGLLDNKQFKFWPPKSDSPPQGIVEEIAKKVDALRTGQLSSPRSNARRSVARSAASPELGGASALSPVPMPVQIPRPVRQQSPSLLTGNPLPGVVVDVAGGSLERCLQAWVIHSKQQAEAQRAHSIVLAAFGCVTAVACVVAWKVLDRNK